MDRDYKPTFYENRHEETLYAARAILSIVMKALPKIRSAVDFGCGVGTWLSVLKENGIDEILGIDGPWVNPELLTIPKEAFRQAHFEEGIHLDKRYDLAISLEVVEHLSPEAAEKFIDSLTTASDFVLFSAAIPFQGGRGHLNEQWPEHWAAFFAKRAFVALDFIRGAIWTDSRIPVWYRQNILMFVKKEAKRHIHVPDAGRIESPFPLPLVHPEIYLSNARQASSLRGSWRLFRKALKNRLQGR